MQPGWNICADEKRISAPRRAAQATETGANRPLFITIPAYANEVANERLDLPPVPSPPGSMLVNVMSVVDQVTSTVPLPVMLMMNALRAGELPDGVALLQIMPCSEHGVEPAGQRIFSLWQGPDVDAVAAAVEGLVGDDCTSTCFPVMEDHMYGVGRESVEEKTARLARKAGANILAFDKRVGISATVTAAAAATVTKVKSLSAPKQPKDGDGAEPDPNAAPDKTSLKYVQENVSKEFNQVNEKLLKPAAEATTKAATDTWNTVSTAVNGLFARKDEAARRKRKRPGAAAVGGDGRVRGRRRGGGDEDDRGGGGGDGTRRGRGRGRKVGTRGRGRGDRAGTAGFARAHVGETRGVIDFRGRLIAMRVVSVVTPTPSPRGAPRVLICTSTMISVVRGDRGGYFLAAAPGDGWIPLGGSPQPRIPFFSPGLGSRDRSIVSPARAGRALIVRGALRTAPFLLPTLLPALPCVPPSLPRVVPVTVARG